MPIRAMSSIAFALFCVRVVADPVPLRGSRAAMEFELAARELRRADEEIKAAAWDEENQGRTPAVDTAVAELARASRNVAQVTAKVVSEVSAQPQRKPRTLQTKARHAARSADSMRYDATDAAVMHQRHQNRLQSSTDAAVQAISQHSHEKKMKKATATSTEQAVKAIQQHGRENAHRNAMSTAADAAVDAIQKHMAERNSRDDINLATDIMASGVGQHSHERAVADATSVATDLVRQHLKENQQHPAVAKDFSNFVKELPLSVDPELQDADEGTLQDLAQDV